MASTKTAWEISATPVAFNAPMRGPWHIINTGAQTIYGKKGPLGPSFAGDAAGLGALADYVIAAKETLNVDAADQVVTLACATALSSTATVSGGHLASAVNVEANIGNVGILDSSEAEIDPATSGNQTNVQANPGSDATKAIAVQGVASGKSLSVTDANLTPTAKTFTAITKTVAATGTGVPLVGSETFARKLVLTAKKATGNNTGYVYIGDSAVDKTTDQQTPLEPGAEFTVDMPVGTKVNLATIYIDADNNDDGVTGYYIPV